MVYMGQQTSTRLQRYISPFSFTCRLQAEKKPNTVLTFSKTQPRPCNEVFVAQSTKSQIPSPQLFPQTSSIFKTHSSRPNPRASPDYSITTFQSVPPLISSAKETGQETGQEAERERTKSQTQAIPHLLNRMIGEFQQSVQIQNNNVRPQLQSSTP
jgi:hypothetical protein